jgi:enamine deaminase RidA (YjgF/YER057c/UK114 family)
MSQAVVHGDTVYLAGQVSDADGVGAQTRDILASIDGLLAECGSDKTKILMATIWLSDIGTFNEMNAEWDAWVPEGNAAARACVESKLAFPQFQVEIRVVAAR